MPKKSNYDVHVDDEAYSKLLRHMRFLSQASIPASKRMYIAYEKTLTYIGKTPNACPPYLLEQTIDEELRCKLFYKRYLLVFSIVGKDVYILDVQDCRQSSDKNLV